MGNPSSFMQGGQAPQWGNQMTPMGGMQLRQPMQFPMQVQPPRLAQPMTVPQFPGVPQHDGTIPSLLEVLRKQTAKKIPKGGSSRDPRDRDDHDDDDHRTRAQRAVDHFNDYSVNTR